MCPSLFPLAGGHLAFHLRTTTTHDLRRQRTSPSPDLAAVTFPLLCRRLTFLLRPARTSPPFRFWPPLSCAQRVTEQKLHLVLLLPLCLMRLDRVNLFRLLLLLLLFPPSLVCMLLTWYPSSLLFFIYFLMILDARSSRAMED